jgi:hypothetical protein
MKIDERLREAARKTYQELGKSDVFILVFNEKMVDEVIPLIQMGLAVYMDKPIEILVPKGARIPGNLRTMAVAIEEYDPDDESTLAGAIERLSKKTKS